MSKKITAVEWLAIQLYKKMEMKGSGKIFDDILKQAKVIEKEQIVEAWYDGAMNWDSEKEVNQYYEETFK